MSVATQLGLNDPDQALLGQARQGWPQWRDEYQVLDVVQDLLALPTWLKEADRSRADEVLHTLAMLGSPTGGDDVAAAGALAWLLLPGATLVAHRLRALTRRIDEVVAAQLWLEVRGFPWERQRKVGANIVMNTRRGVLRDLGVGSSAREFDRTWARCIPLAPTAELWGVLDARRHPAAPSPSVELDEVLDWAMDEGVIQSRDRDLLITLAVAATDAGIGRSGCGQGGLCSRQVADRVARQVGLSSSTVRRRATASLRAVATAYLASARIPA